MKPSHFNFKAEATKIGANVLTGFDREKLKQKWKDPLITHTTVYCSVQAGYDNPLSIR